MAEEIKSIPGDEIRRKVRDLEAILEVSRAMTAEKDIDNLLKRIMDAERSSLFLLDEERHELWSRIAEKSEIREIRVPADKGFVGHVVKTHETLNVEDAYEDPRFNQEVDRRTGYRTRSVLCAPLLTYENRIVGVMQVLNKRGGPFSAYDESVLLALGSHAAIALDNARLVLHYIEKQKMKQALEIASDIQRRLLPRFAPVIENFELFGWTLPCDETGGDYYDFIKADDGSLAIVIADVSGHGIGAALLMAAVRAYLRGLVTANMAPAQVLFQLNNLLSQDMEAGRFVTLFCGILDPRTRKLTYTSAGHDPPMVLHKGGEVIELDSTSLPLGIMENSEFPVGEDVIMSPGDLVVFTTDGVWEAMTDNAEEYGRDRLKALITAHAGERPEAMVKLIHEDVAAFSGKCKQRDDLTLIVLKAV
jgi:sigma-B regulation protein RsbU (phosphoserine phosphatase)